MEFSEQLRERGVPLIEAAVQAATIGLRPILMTSLAFILGVVPLVFTTGAGENGRHWVGTTVFGGMIMSTILNLFFIPVLYLIIEGWREHGEEGTGTAQRCVIFRWHRVPLDADEPLSATFRINSTGVQITLREDYVPEASLLALASCSVAETGDYCSYQR